MAPKKPPPAAKAAAAAPKTKAAAAPKTEAAAAAAAKKPEKGDEKPPDPEAGKKFYEKKKFGVAAKVALVVFLILAIVMISLYFYERSTNADVEESMAILREAAVDFEAKYETADDYEILAVAQNFSQEFVNIVTNVENIQKEIDTHGASLENWRSYDSNLFYFSRDEQTFANSITECQKRHAELASNMGPYDMSYIEGIVKVVNVDLWIGLIQKDPNSTAAVFFDGNTPRVRAWYSKERFEKGSCVLLLSKGFRRHFWIGADCEELHCYICKKKAKKNLYF